MKTIRKRHETNELTQQASLGRFQARDGLRDADICLSKPRAKLLVERYNSPDALVRKSNLSSETNWRIADLHTKVSKHPRENCTCDFSATIEAQAARAVG